jgi:hypothetical protein
LLIISIVEHSSNKSRDYLRSSAAVRKEDAPRRKEKALHCIFIFDDLVTSLMVQSRTLNLISASLFLSESLSYHIIFKFYLCRTSSINILLQKFNYNAAEFKARSRDSTRC